MTVYCFFIWLYYKLKRATPYAPIVRIYQYTDGAAFYELLMEIAIIWHINYLITWDVGS